jgi:hypothetical protein
MRRTILVAALLASFVIATPVTAAPPSRGCPPAFTEATTSELLATWPQFDPVEFGAFLAVLDANENGELCWAAFPENSAKFGDPFFVANFIDDVANSQR